MELSRSRARGELSAVVLTGALFLVFENILDAKLPFLAAAGVAWTLYVAARLRSTPGLADAWGLGRKGFAEAAAGAAGIFAAGLAGLLVYRTLLGWQPLPPGAPIVFLAYPAWALVQQFALQALVAGNFDRLGAPRPLTVLVTGLLFGLAHAPDWPLAVVCAATGLVWAALYLRTRNLWPLALCHAWLGALAYYWLLERDPWREMFPI